MRLVGEAETLFGKIHRVQMAKCYYNGSYITAYISNYALIVNVLAPVLMWIASPLVVDSLLAFRCAPGSPQLPGSARVSRVGFNVSPKQSFPRSPR